MNHKIFTILAIIITLSGCAANPQLAVYLKQENLSNKGTVGVAMTALPEVNTHFPGADCLLCLAAASIANKSLTAHTKTLTHDTLPKLKNEIAALLKKNGSDILLIEEVLDVNKLSSFKSKGPNIALKDFSSLKEKYNIEKLLVLDINRLGVVRSYASYIPTSDPKANLRGFGYIVNLSSNMYEWYLPVDINKSAEGVWDEAPSFPGITNAYYQAIEIGKDTFKKPLISAMPDSNVSQNVTQ